MDEHTPPADQDAPATPASPHEPGFGERLAENRRTFQPGLWLRLIVIGLVLAYLILFVVLNTHRVRVRFVFSDTNVSLIWVIALSGVIGLIVGVLLSQLHRFRGRRRAAARS